MKIEPPTPLERRPSERRPPECRPPQWADRFLAWFCHPKLLPEVAGDLHELYQRWVKVHGLRKARWLYIFNVITFLRPFFFKRKSSQYSQLNYMDMFSHYFKVGFRNLLRYKVFSFINVSGLSIGLACCMLIVLYTKDEVSFDRFHEKKDQIFRVTATISGEKGVNKIGSTNQIVGPSFAAEIPEVESFVRMQTNSFIVRRGTDTFDQSAVFVDNNFFSVFSLPLIYGNAENVLDDLHAVVLSEETAEKYFGTTAAVGKTLELEVGEKFEPFVVTGIAKNPPQNSSIQFDMLLPFEYNLKQYTDNAWIGFYMNTFVVLNPKADYKAVEPKLDQVFLSKAREELRSMKEKFNFNETVHFGLQPLLQMHLDTEYGDSRNGLAGASKPIYSYILTGIAIFILVIACINFINLTIAHSLKRGKEIGIRKVIGGQRRQLIGQFLGESFILCLFAFVAAIVVVQLVLPFFNELANKRLSFSYLLDLKLISSYILLFLVTGLTAGFYPALVLSGFSPIQTIYNRHQLASKNYLAKGLVVLQFALATFLIIATMGIYSQFNYLTHKDLGYNDKNLVVVNLGRGDHSALVETFKNELNKEPVMEVVTTKNPGQNYTIAKVDGEELEFAISWVDEKYLPTLQIPVIQGRNFSQDFPSDAAQSVIINETFAKEAGWEEPIGKEVDFFYNHEKLKVIGVVKDYHFESLKEKIKPLLFKVGSGDLWIKIKPDHISQALQAIQETYKKLVPFRPLSYDFMNTINERNYEAEAKWKQMITIGAVLSIFISCMGLFGLTMLSIQQRAKEVGIRKVLGAAVSNIVFLLSQDFMKLVVVAFLIAIPLGYYAVDRWLENFAYRIELSWWIFVLAGILAVLIALLTVSYQAIKAAVANPVDSLRNE